MSAATVDRTTGRASSPGDIGETLHMRFDQVARHALCNSVRRALPGISAPEALKAVRTLATLTTPESLPDATRAAARADYLSTPSDGSMQSFPVPPDGWEARKHGALNVEGKITVRGKARIQGVTTGDLSAPCADELPDGIRERLHLALCQVERTTIGASAFDVDRITDLYFCGEIPRKVGTDALLAHEIGRDEEPSEDGGYGHPELRGVTGHAHHKAQHPARLSLPRIVGRKSEGVSKARLAAHADREGYLWIGHKLTARGVLVKGKLAASTLPPVTVSDLAELDATVATLERGQGRKITYRGKTLTVRRGKSTQGFFGVRAGKGKGKDVYRGSLRTVASVTEAAEAFTS